ncbi:hypothetical protein [Alkalicoccobacillus gibsonii]|uniref:hypothetical protein n=1 Tax=Alkalicoccobacillus gibsonii TaxID=79881 RepID=UPI0019345506|nr:hypothetical protein [Alkalicoccobacillus gibsonii]MBM0065469.1 hypothetical protein [Alkalicoccobacillus gibsonii]
MKNRNKNYYRHHRSRIIKKKLDFLKNVRKSDNDDPLIKTPGLLSKGKVHCSCKMCKYDKHFDVPKRQDQSKYECMNNELDEYFKFNQSKKKE